jgi:hypothetical protein
MRFIDQILRATPLNEQLSFRACFRSVAFRLPGKVVAKPYPWRVHIRFLLRMTLLIWSIPVRLKRARSAKAIVYNVATTADERRYFYKKYQNPDLKDEEVLTLHHDTPFDKLYYQKLGWVQLKRLFRAAWILWRATFRSAFWRTRVNPHWKIRFGNLLLQQVLWHGDDRDQLLYFCYEPETYLSTLVASAMIPDYFPKIVTSNSLLFADNRYLHNPKADLKICSKVQVAETEAYRKKGWMQVRSVELWGLEEALVYDHLPRTEPIYDIGIYSSGGWARTHDLWRASDLSILRKGGYLDNPLYLQLGVILEVVCALKREFPQLRVGFYPHPHELNLYHKHDIRPPYLPLLEANGIQCSLESQNSMERIYEPKLAVAVSSTILFDRLHLGLQSFFYAGKAVPKVLTDVRYIGEMAKLGYLNGQELREMMLRELSLPEKAG